MIAAYNGQYIPDIYLYYINCFHYSKPGTLYSHVWFVCRNVETVRKVFMDLTYNKKQHLKLLPTFYTTVTAPFNFFCSVPFVSYQYLYGAPNTFPKCTFGCFIYVLTNNNIYRQYK